MNPFQPLQRRWRRTQYSNGVRTDRVEELADVAGQSRCARWVAIVDQNAGECRKGGIEHRLAITRFAGIKIFETLVDGQLKRVVVREVALNNDLAALIAAARPARDLSQKL